MPTFLWALQLCPSLSQGGSDLCPALGFLSTSVAVWSPPCTVSCPGTLPCNGQWLSWPWGVLHPLFTPFLACQQNSCLVSFWEISREMMGAVRGAWMPHPCRQWRVLHPCRDEGKWVVEGGANIWMVAVDPRDGLWADPEVPLYQRAQRGWEISSSCGMKVSVAMVMPKRSPPPRLSGLWNNKNFLHSRASSWQFWLMVLVSTGPACMFGAGRLSAGVIGLLK